MNSGAETPQNTFVIKVIAKQNSTWQGTVTWVEAQQKQNFRSALELLKLIDGALDETVDIKGGNNEE